MARTNTRLRINEIGQIEIIDPGLESVDLLREINPEFRIKTADLQAYQKPRFMRLRDFGSGITHKQLANNTDECLFEILDTISNYIRKEKVSKNLEIGEASVLDIKIELTRRNLTTCRLCAHRCGVNRFQGQVGICRLGAEVTVAEHFVHIAEESPINPSLVLNLAGCSLRCRFCQQSSLLNPSTVIGESLTTNLWNNLDTNYARSISFVGGNPDESLFAILRFLNGAPQSWNLPIVWNSHGYATVETVKLLEGVVDAYVPDYKYGNDACGQKLSGVANYTETAKSAIAAMINQEVPVIVRILVLPNHLDCCHKTVLENLAAIAEKNLLVSIRDQYCPDWKITQIDGALARRVTTNEVIAVREYAERLGLSLID